MFVIIGKQAYKMRPSALQLAGRYNQWPWPTKLPLKKNWFHHLSRTESIASESKQVFIVGDLVVVGVLAFALYRFYVGRVSQAHQSRLCHLTGMPPAIIAQDFDFTDVEKNRKIDRKQLDAYRNEFAAARVARQSVESFIFKY